MPLAVEFPFPAWATRQSEWAPRLSFAGGRNGVARDPFARAGCGRDEFPF